MGIDVGYALLFYVFGFFFLYWVVRAAVRAGIEDADRRRATTSDTGPRLRPEARPEAPAAPEAAAQP